MNKSQKIVFLLLIASQGLHSIEEVYFELWRVFEPAGFISGLINDDQATGFIIGNIAVVLAGIISVGYVFNAGGSRSKWLVFVWLSLEFVNFSVHSVMAFKTAGYFPGVYSAPLLLVFSVLLGLGLIGRTHHQGK